MPSMSILRRGALFPSVVGIHPVQSEQLPTARTLEPLSDGSDNEEIVRLITAGSRPCTIDADYDIVGVLRVTDQHTPVTDVLLISPTAQQRTPHEAPDNSQAPHLSHRHPPKHSSAIVAPFSAYSSSGIVQQQQHHPKVRLALFPDMEIPTRRFYSASAPASPMPSQRFSSTSSRSKLDTSVKSGSSGSMNGRRARGSRARHTWGQINAGVRHKVRRPRRKPMDKKLALEAALHITDRTPLREIHTPNTESTDVKEVKSPSPAPQPQLEDSHSADSAHNKSLCDLTSGLAITSPQKPRLFDIFYPSNHGVTMRPNFDTSATTVVDNTNNNMTKKRKLPAHSTCVSSSSSSLSTTTNTFAWSRRKMRKIALDTKQMQLDAGQKRWGMTQCAECQFIYDQSDPIDEISHSQFHSASNTFRFNGWKNERVISAGVNTVFGNTKAGRVLKVLPGDPKVWWKRVNEILRAVNRELGIYDDFRANNVERKIQMVLLYVVSRCVVGVLVAEPKPRAYRMLTGSSEPFDRCTQETFPIKCAVSVLWVHNQHQRQGIGTLLMDTLKCNFSITTVLKNEEIAISAPTPAGKRFATKYFQSEQFLTY